MDGNRGKMKSIDKILINLKVKGYRCLRCNYEWMPRKNKKKKGKPRTCPKCRTTYWDKPKKITL